MFHLLHAGYQFVSVLRRSLEESIDVLMYALRLDCTMGELEPHPVYTRINTITSLNGEKRAGHKGGGVQD